MELPRVMLIYTVTTLILSASIVLIPTLGRLALFRHTFMPLMSSKMRQHSTPLTSSKVDLLILGADWLVYLTVFLILAMGTDKLQGFDQCAILLNMEFERVFYKNNFASGVELLNIYMICKMASSSIFCWTYSLTLQRWRNELGQSGLCW